MRVADLAAPSLRAQLAREGLVLTTGPFTFRVVSPIERVADGIGRLYAEHAVGAADDFADFTVSILPGRGWRRWVKPQVAFHFDGQRIFDSLPRDQAFPLLEWAMNWCISGHAHDFLIVHAACVERGGRAVVLPAPPGSGKSTLCAALIHSGWRLLSDELALISHADGRLWPLARPVSLKNASIDVIRRFAPSAEFNRITHATLKGSVTHMKTPRAHLAAANVPALPRWIVFTRYEPGAPTELAPRPRASSLVDLARNAFNFSVLGERGFDTLGDVVAASECFDFRYSDLDQAIAAFDALAQSGP